MENWTSHIIYNGSLNSSTPINASDNTTSSEDTFSHKWSFEFSVVLACIMSISAFCTVVGNSMVLMVIIRHRGMRTRTNLFLLNLAITDLLVGLFVEPFSITTLIENRWVFGEKLCALNGWMNSFCLITSFHTLMYISIHKYFSIVKPLSSPLQLQHIIIMMISAWLWAAICSTLNIAVLVVEYKPGTSQCGPRYPSTAGTFIVHGLFQLTVMYIPAAILLFCYIRMFRAIKKHSKRLLESSTVEEAFILAQNKKVATTLFIVLATFVMMALPYHLYATYTTIEKDKKHFSVYLNPLAYMFLYLSSMCNPIIYAFRSPAFREGYKEILCQTPNYVISDEFEQLPGKIKRSSVLSSFRRSTSSRCSNGKMINCTENKDTFSSTRDTEEKPTKPKFQKQKSVMELLRSTRQSAEQSVVHRNGDIIIMKGGKIVCVRREGENSPFLDRFRALQKMSEHNTDLVAGLAGTGRVVFGLVCEGVADENKATAVTEEKEFSQNSDHEIQVEQSTEHLNKDTSRFTENNTMNSQFNSKIFLGENYCYDQNINGNEFNYSDAEMTSISETSKQSRDDVNLSLNSIKEPASLTKNMREFSDGEFRSNRRNLPYLETSSLRDRTAASSNSSLHSGGIVIHVNDDDDILSVMPLTPHTREYLAKSDMQISQSGTEVAESHGQTSVFKAVQLSHSSDNILRKPPVFQRLPSMEFLDPPVHLFRSHSNLSMHSSSRRHIKRSKLSRKRERSHSPDVGLSSKSYIRSPFSSRNKVTHV